MRLDYVNIDSMKMNALHYVLLAGIDAEPRSGYSLTQWLARVGQHFWAAEHSSIYPALQFLEAQGLVVHKEEPGQKGKLRKVYRLSASGRRKLKQWIDEPSGEPQIRDEQMVKALCFDLLPRPRILEHLRRIRTQHAERLAYYQELLAQHSRGEGPREQKAYASRLGPQLTLRRGIIAARGYVEWCDEAIGIISRPRD